jgi:hypothetical protein
MSVELPDNLAATPPRSLILTEQDHGEARRRLLRKEDRWSRGHVLTRAILTGVPRSNAGATAARNASSSWPPDRMLGLM